MTKKEFTYWSENYNKFLNADLIYICFNKDIFINTAKTISNKNLNTLNPDIKYGNYNSDFYSADKVIEVNFDNDKIILKTKIKHSYIDWEDKKIKDLLVGEVITNTFSRKDIKSIDVRIYS